jgi:hypothetical protein
VGDVDGDAAGALLRRAVDLVLRQQIVAAVRTDGNGIMLT